MVESRNSSPASSKTLDDVLQERTGVRGGRYRIEFHQYPLGPFSHDYWVLRNLDSGQVIDRLQGLATDTMTPNLKNRAFGSHKDTLLFRNDPETQLDGQEGTGSGPFSPENSKPIFSLGDDLSGDEVIERWNNAIKRGKELNKQNIPYELVGGINGRINEYDDDRNLVSTRLVKQANSNSAAMEIGRALGIPEAEIRDAIKNSPLFSPGSDRNLQELYPGAVKPPVERAPLPAPTSSNRHDDLRERFAEKLTAPGEPAEEVLLKEPRDWTETEMREVISAPLYRANSDPLARFANERVRAWHESVYGTSTLDRLGVVPVVPPDEPRPPRTATGGDMRDDLWQIADTLAGRAQEHGEFSAVQDWQSGLNGLLRRRLDGTDVFLPTLKVDGDFGPRTRFATKQALVSHGLAPLLKLFG